MVVISTLDQSTPKLSPRMPRTQMPVVCVYDRTPNFLPFRSDGFVVPRSEL